MITFIMAAMLAFSAAGELQNAITPETFQTIENASAIILIELPSGKEIKRYEKNDLVLLKSYLLDSGSYYFDKTKTCLFISEYVLKFPDSDNIAVYISPSGKQLKFQFDGKSKILDYDPIAKPLSQILQQSGD